MIEIDIGCGFTEGVQKPVYADISLDFNMDKVSPKFLQKLKDNGSHPMRGDAQNLGIRDDCVGKLYWKAVLEHLPDPHSGMKEGVRILKEGGEAEVVLPIITAHMRHYIIILFTQFPFSLYTILIALYRAGKYWDIEGVPHLVDVKPENLKWYFKKVEISKRFYRHKWFHSPWGKVTKKLVNQRFIPDIQGQYDVRCWK